MNRRILTFALTLCLFGSASLHAETFPVAEDTYGNTVVEKGVSTSTLTSASGSAGSLTVSKAHTALLRFDVGASGINPAIITHARLVLYFPIVAKAGGLNLHAVTQNWSESFKGAPEAQPAYTESPIATIPSSYVIAKQFVTIDVTAQVQAWLTVPGSDFGFAIDTTDGAASVLIGAKEGPATGYPAVLEVDDAVVAAGANVTVVDVVASGDVTAAGNVTASGNVSGNGSGLTGLNATSIASGTLADARLSTNVPLLEAANAFTAVQTFSLGTVISPGVSYSIGLTGVGSADFGLARPAGSFSTDAGLNDAVLRAPPGQKLLLQSGAGASALQINASNDVSLTTGLTLPATTSATVGVITQGGSSLIQAFGTNNFFAGSGAGNFTMTGAGNTAAGVGALTANTTGSSNIALGENAGSLLTTGSHNIDIGHPGVAGESNVIRIGDGTTQTDTYLTGVIHGNGSALTGIASGNLSGSITAAQIATGAVGSTQLASGLTLAGMTTGMFSGSLAETLRPRRASRVR